MRQIRYMKGAVPIRTIIIASLVMVLLTFSVVLFTGSYAYSNNLPINNTVSSQYNSLIGNPSNPNSGLFSNYLNLTSQVGSQGSQLHNSNLQFGLFNTIGIAAQFFTSLGPIIGGFLQFISIPLEAVGIPAGYAVIIMAVMLLAIMALGILSAIFLFPI